MIENNKYSLNKILTKKEEILKTIEGYTIPIDTLIWDYSDSSLIDRKIYDDDENPNLSKVNFKYFYKAGKIIKDTTLTGEIRIGGDLVIPVNVKLTIKEPAILKFAKNFDILKSGNDINKTELIIYGRLKIESENEKIIFTSDGFIKEKEDFYGIIFKYDIEAQRNWWGTENKDSIMLLIFDFYDDSTKGKVYFEPIWKPKENISGIQGYEEIKEEFIKLKNTIFRNFIEIEIISFKDSKINLKIYDVSGRCLFYRG